MKKATIILLLINAALAINLTLASCTKTDEPGEPCGYHNGSELFLGPKGGCYYLNSNGNKTYVDRSECKC